MQISRILSLFSADDSLVEISQTLKEEIIPFLYKLFNEIAEEGIHNHSFFEASITQIPEKNITGKKTIDEYHSKK